MPPSIADDPILSSLWRYWDAKRGRRRMPLRNEIDPSEIPRLLPYLQLVEHVEGKGFRYRLTGTAIAQGYGFDATGKFTHEILSPARHAVASRHYALAFESGRPLFTRNLHVKSGCLLLVVSQIILPLSLDGARAGMLLLGQTFASPTPDEQMTSGADIDVARDEVEFLDAPRMLAPVSSAPADAAPSPVAANSPHDGAVSAR